MAVKIDGRKLGARDEMLGNDECGGGLVFADIGHRRVWLTVAPCLTALRDPDSYHGAEKCGSDEPSPPCHARHYAESVAVGR